MEIILIIIPVTYAQQQIEEIIPAIMAIPKEEGTSVICIKGETNIEWQILSNKFNPEQYNKYAEWIKEQKYV